MDVGLRVEGLADLRRTLRRIEKPNELAMVRVGLKAAAEVVAANARARVPVRSGRARGSIRATSGGNRAFVVGGRATVPYYGWLDFGGRAPISGRPRSVGPWAGTGGGKEGRFIYPAIEATRTVVVHMVESALVAAIKEAGL